MKLLLSVVSSNANLDCPSRITLNQESATIGRGVDNTLVLLDPNKTISRHHALIEYRSPDYFITDISSHGVLINECSIPLGKGNSKKLSDGNQLHIGDYTISVKLFADSVNPTSFSKGTITDHGLPGGTRNQPKATISEPNLPPPITDIQNEFIQNFLLGAKLENSKFAEAITPETFYTIGTMLRASIQGTRDVLEGRVRIKNEMHMDVTLIRHRENNPIKFSVSTDEALAKLLTPTDKAYLSPEKVINEAFDDIRTHQYSVIAGMKSALFAILKRFDPKMLEDRLQKQSPIAANAPFIKQAKLWRLFEELYETLEQETKDNFYHLFGQAFADTYTQLINKSKKDGLSDDHAEPDSLSNESQKVEDIISFDDPFAEFDSEPIQGINDSDKLIPSDWKTGQELPEDLFGFPSLDADVSNPSTDNQHDNTAFEHVPAYKEAFQPLPKETVEKPVLPSPAANPTEIFPEDWFLDKGDKAEEIAVDKDAEIISEPIQSSPIPQPSPVIAPSATNSNKLVSPPEEALRNARITKACRIPTQPNAHDVTDVVDCTVFAPPYVNTKIDQCFLVHVFVHLSDQAEAAKQLAKEFDEAAERRGYKSLETAIERGSQLTFHLSMPTLKVTDPVQTLIWRGSIDSVQFAVDIPDDLKVGIQIGTVTISQYSVPIGQISFKLKLSVDKNSQQPNIMGEAKAYKKAFISYASCDRNEVLKRVQMLSRLNIDFFQDLLSLKSGQRWEHEIFHNIDESDVFFLFWSSAAKASQWVMDEVSYAVKLKNGDDSNPPAIVPIIIEGPPPVRPPEELAHLHFNDYLMYLMN
jgi:predicted component of type VI protein secretion system